MQADHHIHIILDGADWRAAIAAHRGGPNEAVIRQRLQAYQAAGVTYLRDGGDRWGVCLLARNWPQNTASATQPPVRPSALPGATAAFWAGALLDAMNFVALWQ